VRRPSRRSSSGQTSARTSDSAVSPSAAGSSTFDSSRWRSANGPVRDALDGGEQQLLGRQLEVDGALRQHAVLELEGARVPGEHVRQDALDLHARGFAELALVHEAALGEHLRERVAGADLGVDLVELVARDAAALDQDRPELVLRVVGRAEEHAPAAEVQCLRMDRAVDLERARGSVAMQIHEKVGKRLRVNVPADRERFRHSALHLDARLGGGVPPKQKVHKS
jgi:hypothetical protein